MWDEECESEDDVRNQRDVALVYTRRYTQVTLMATRVFSLHN